MAPARSAAANIAVLVGAAGFVLAIVVGIAFAVVVFALVAGGGGAAVEE